MDPRLNPFAPGAGIQPPELRGRDTILEAADIQFHRLVAGRPVKGSFLLGLRGVGKTVLLNRMVALSERAGVCAVRIEAPDRGELPQMLVPELKRVLYELDMLSSMGNRIKTAFSVLSNFASAFKVKVGEIEFGIDARSGIADTGNLQQDLPALIRHVAEVAQERGSALCIFIDEMQYLSKDELSAIIVSAHDTAQRGLPCMFIGAGLPVVAALAGNAKSYAERLFDYPEIDKLDKESAALAVSHPALLNGVVFDDGAVLEVLRQTQCYPYFLQVWASFAWDAARTSTITKTDVVSVTRDIVPYLDKNFFRVRFDRLTPLQQKYLRAMAELGVGPYKTGDIALALGCEPNELSVTRQQLIKNGMVWSQRHGETAFTVPLFEAFMQRAMPILSPHEPKRRGGA